MVTRFEFATAQRIVFGRGVVQEAGILAKAAGTRALVVTGRNPVRSEPLLGLLRAQGMEVHRFSIEGEPSVADIRSGTERAVVMKANVILGCGGGSALDGAKAIAALAANPGDPVQYLEVIGEGRTLQHRPLPCMAIPTTAGTGSEVTRNAVLASPEHGVKVSLRHAWMLPQIALVDPELTLGLPPETTASTGLDALTQLVEPFLSIRANPLTDAFCREGIPRVVRSLRRAWADGRNLEAREDMALASLLGGLALANAGLGAVHGLAASLGGLKPVPHGAACAALLPHVLEANLEAMAEGGADLTRFHELARLLAGKAEASALDGVACLHALARELQINGLGRYGVAACDAETVVERAMGASSMKANPVKLSREALVGVLLRAL